MSCFKDADKINIETINEKELPAVISSIRA